MQAVWTTAVQKLAQELGPSNRIWLPWSETALEQLRRVMLSAYEAGATLEDLAGGILEMGAAEVWMPSPSAELLVALMGNGPPGPIRCSFSLATHVAWLLARTTPVHLDVENDDLASLIRILAKACVRTISVDVNRIESLADRLTPNEEFVQILLFPPLGMRISRDGNFRGRSDAAMSSDAYAALWGSRLRSKRCLVIVGNGFLSRTKDREVAIKRELIDNALAEVVSLPRGAYPYSNVATSVLIFDKTRANQAALSKIRFIDAADETGKAHLWIADWLITNRPDAYADIPTGTIRDSEFNMSVERYVLDADARESRNILENRDTVRLTDIAEMYRAQALPKVSDEEPMSPVRETMLADIVDGSLRLPQRLGQVPVTAMRKVETAMLHPGDVLLSVKGTIGKVGFVGEDVIADSEGIPLIPAQSIVVLRLRKKGPIGDPVVLARYLETRVFQSLLQSIAGGTTIPNVAMGELKDLQVPVLSPPAQAHILRMAKEREWLQAEMKSLQARMDDIDTKILDVIIEDNLPTDKPDTPARGL
jgi:hypothetical protein